MVFVRSELQYCCQVLAQLAKLYLRVLQAALNSKKGENGQTASASHYIMYQRY